MENTAQMLRSFREHLPHPRKTAAAIDRSASLEEILELAEEESLRKRASELFEAGQEQLRAS